MVPCGRYKGRAEEGLVIQHGGGAAGPGIEELLTCQYRRGSRLRAHRHPADIHGCVFSHQRSGKLSCEGIRKAYAWGASPMMLLNLAFTESSY
ncbi:hypothetical protein E2C01_085407 [Portunus trituberculatus]|uniref:Uncharacterized protein n=1 Tax=Portunus trituberculatus TaxID=210409 RepID=A0A5B7J0W5_PORTR|nr:hypothetical protein [Portunus trituberculatus]